MPKTCHADFQDNFLPPAAILPVVSVTVVVANVPAAEMPLFDPHR
jgi:hypothetical protein